MRKFSVQFAHLFLNSSWTPKLCVKTLRCPFRPHFWASLARAPFRASSARAYDAQNAFRGRQLTQLLTHSSCIVLRELQKFSSTTVLNSCFVAANDHSVHHHSNVPRASCLFFQTSICVSIRMHLSSYQAVQ